MSADEILYVREGATQKNGAATLPADIQDALDIEKGEDKVAYELRKDGTVVLKNAEQAEP